MPAFRKDGFFVLAINFAIYLALYGLFTFVYNVRYPQATKSRGQWPLDLRIGIIFQMCTQFALMVGAVMTIIGVFSKKHLFFFYTTFVIYIVICCTQITLGIFAFKDSAKDLSQEMKAYLKSTDNLEWMSTIESKYGCCGVESYLDYNVLQLKVLGKMDVPYSCCRQKASAPEPTCGHGIFGPNMNHSQVEKTITTEGCANFLKKTYGSKLIQMGFETIIIGGLAGFFAAFLYWGIGILKDYDELERGRGVPDEEDPVDIGAAGDGPEIRLPLRPYRRNVHGSAAGDLAPQGYARVFTPINRRKLPGRHIRNWFSMLSTNPFYPMKRTPIMSFCNFSQRQLCSRYIDAARARAILCPQSASSCIGTPGYGHLYHHSILPFLGHDASNQTKPVTENGNCSNCLSSKDQEDQCTAISSSNFAGFEDTDDHLLQQTYVLPTIIEEYELELVVEGQEGTAEEADGTIKTILRVDGESDESEVKE